VNLVRRMQESEEKKWSSLEKVRIEYDWWKRVFREKN
jgi:hypothetical protein